jgi:hypothetical protein
VAKTQPGQQNEAAMTEITPGRLNSVITIYDERIKSHPDRVVRGSVEGDVAKTELWPCDSFSEAILIITA